MSWPVVKMSEIFDIARGGSPRPIDQFITDAPDGVNWIMIGDTKGDSKYIDKTAKKIKPEGVKKSREVKKGDFLLTNSMSFGRPYILRTSGCIHDGWLVLSPKTDQIFTDYFYHYLGSTEVKNKLASKAAGAVVKNLNKDIVKDLEIPLPPLDEQKRIAAILDKSDNVRRKRQQAIDLADDFLRSVFLDMFGDPLVNSKKWQVQNLGELTTKITDGKHGDCEDELGSGYYFISAKDVNHGRINYENTRQINKKEFDEVHRRTDLQAGDLVMVNTGATIGRVAIVMDDEKTCKTTFQKSVAIIKPKGDLLNSNFLKYIFLLRVKDFASVGSGSAIKNLLLSKMREFPIIVPPMELQRKFDRIVSHIESSSIRYSADSELNDELFNSLSQKAFAGEL